MSAAETILHDALALPRTERSKVAAELIASLDDASDDEVDAAWAEEIERRVARIRSRESEGIPAEDVHARIRAALRR
ncbi:MAG TPA: addiction module protein [Sandaracinaceae bacterium LLY-WYZ-13_1]|nr:addiction module protein [Sandaracinaceae bacterium LLY-WYZ-13_1]